MTFMLCDLIPFFFYLAKKKKLAVSRIQIKIYA